MELIRFRVNDGGILRPLEKWLKAGVMAADKLLANVNIVLTSHLHLDHFDPAAMDIISKQLPIYSQPEDENRLRDETRSNQHTPKN